MSLSIVNFHEAANSLSIIRSRPSSAFWRRYVEGVNLTFYRCHDLPQRCLPPLASNEFRLMNNDQSIEHVGIPGQPRSAYISSLIVPIFDILAQRVNASLQFFVSQDNQNVHEMNAVAHNLVTAGDNVPMIYTYYQGKWNQTCAPPLFLYGQLQILSARMPLNGSAENIFTTFSIKLWLAILVVYLLVVGLECFIQRSTNANTLSNITLNYFKPIVAKEAQTNHYTRFLFIFWLLGVIPLVEIFRNDMIAKIVETRYRTIDSIEELLAHKHMDILRPQADDYLFSHFYSEQESGSDLQDPESAQRIENYKKLLNRSQPLSWSEKWMDGLLDPRVGLPLLRRTAVIEDENALNYFEQILSKVGSIHRSSEIYMPSHITPICYMSNFAYKKEINKLSRELFEKGFYNRWQQEKADFLIAFGVKVLKMFSDGGDLLGALRTEAERADQMNTEQLFSFVFKLFAVLTIVNVVVFVLEMTYFFLFKARIWNKFMELFKEI